METVQDLAAQGQRIALQMPWGEVVWHVWDAHATSHKPPLVLLHGGSGSWTHWVRNVLPLSQRHAVWALDLPGFGDSALPPQVRDADTLAPYLGEVLQRTFAGQAVAVVGFSFGGMTAGLLAAGAPQHISQLILVGVPGLGVMQERLPMRGMLPEMTRTQQRAVHRHNLHAMMLADANNITEDVIDMQEANVARDRMRRRRIARSDVLAQVQQRWQCPVHGIWGEQDALYQGLLPRVPEVLHRMQTFHVIPGAGHWVAYEQADNFNAVVEQLLSSNLG